jgi:hypothetical protein
MKKKGLNNVRLGKHTAKPRKPNIVIVKVKLNPCILKESNNAEGFRSIGLLNLFP